MKKNNINGNKIIKKRRIKNAQKKKKIHIFTVLKTKQIKKKKKIRKRNEPGKLEPFYKTLLLL